MTYNELDGLVVEGLHPRLAQLLVEYLENVSMSDVMEVERARVAAQRQHQPTTADGKPNRARWRTADRATPDEVESVVNALDRKGQDLRVPQTPDTGLGAVIGALPDMPGPDDAEEAPSVDDTAADAPEADTGAPEPSGAQDGPQDAAADDAEPAPDASAACSPEDPDDGGDMDPEAAENLRKLMADEQDEDDAPAVKPEAVMPEEPKPQPSRRKRTAGPKKPPPRVQDLPVKLPNIGDKFEDVEVIKTVDHGDGGRLLIRTDGLRVKLDKKGKVEARVEGEPPDISDIKPAEPTHVTDAPESEPPLEIPDEIRNGSTKQVIDYLVKKGVTDKDALVVECSKMRERGTKCFQACKDEDSIRRRVSSMLIVMGRV